MTRTARGEKAQRKLARLEEELAEAREEYREASTVGSRPWRKSGKAHPRELRMIAERGEALAERVERGRELIAKWEGGEAA